MCSVFLWVELAIGYWLLAIGYWLFGFAPFLSAEDPGMVASTALPQSPHWARHCWYAGEVTLFNTNLHKYLINYLSRLV
ncbi:hypothetical protein ACQKPX_08940 [Photobacterium sp. DNB23_23_1]